MLWFSVQVLVYRLRQNQGSPAEEIVTVYFYSCYSGDFVCTTSTWILHHSHHWACRASRGSVAWCRTLDAHWDLLLVGVNMMVEGWMCAVSSRHITELHLLLVGLEPVHLPCQRWAWTSGLWWSVLPGCMRSQLPAPPTVPLKSAPTSLPHDCPCGCRFFPSPVGLVRSNSPRRRFAFWSHRSWVPVILH